MGQTRLELASAETLLDALPDGVDVADCSPLDDPAIVFSTIARELGLRETEDHSSPERLVLPGSPA